MITQWVVYVTWAFQLHTKCNSEHPYPTKGQAMLRQQYDLQLGAEAAIVIEENVSCISNTSSCLSLG